MRVGIVCDGTWQFLKDILGPLNEIYEVRVFEPKFIKVPAIGHWVNDRLLSLELNKFLRSNDLTWFEWAGHLLQRVSQFEKMSKVIVRVHSRELFERVPDINWERVSKVILVSKAMESHFRKTTGKEDTAIIHNGVPLTTYNITPRPFLSRLGMVGLHPVKRIYEMILLLPELQSKGYSFELRIAGERNKRFLRYAKSMENLVEKLDLKDSVVFDGYVDDMAQWYWSVDIFISNSYWEGQQVSMLEAMASGCYCLSHFWDGAEEVLPEEQIYSTTADLQKKLIMYCRSPESEKRHRQKTMRSIAEEKFDQRRMVREIVKVIEEVANK